MLKSWGGGDTETRDGWPIVPKTYRLGPAARLDPCTCCGGYPHLHASHVTVQFSRPHNSIGDISYWEKVVHSSSSLLVFYIKLKVNYTLGFFFETYFGHCWNIQYHQGASWDGFWHKLWPSASRCLHFPLGAIKKISFMIFNVYC